MVAAGLDLDLDLDPVEERRAWVEDQPVGPGLDLGEVADAAVVVGLRSATSSSPRKSWTRIPRAGSPRSVSSTWVEITAASSRPARRRATCQRTRSVASAVSAPAAGSSRGSRAAWTRCSRAISFSSARTRWPSRTTSSPPTYSRSTRCGAESTSPATGSAPAPPSSRPSVRQTAMSARLPGRELADVVPAEHRRAAARPEPQRLAYGHRARAAAAPRDEQRLLDLEEEVAALVRGRAVDAEPDRRARVDQLAHGRDTRARAEGSRSGSGRPRRRPGRTRRRRPARGARSARTRRLPATQPSCSRYSTGRQPYSSWQYVVLLDRLGEVGVQPQPEPAGQRRPTRPSAPSSPRTASRARPRAAPVRRRPAARRAARSRRARRRSSSTS